MCRLRIWPEKMPMKCRNPRHWTKFKMASIIHWFCSKLLVFSVFCLRYPSNGYCLQRKWYEIIIWTCKKTIFFGFRIQNGRNNTDFCIISRFSMPSYILLNVGGNDSSNEIFFVKFVIYTKFRLKKHQSLKIFFIYLTLVYVTLVAISCDHNV